MSDQIEAFLKGTPAPDEPQPVEQAAPEPEAKPAETPAPKVEDDDEPLPEAREGEPVVPRRALEDERHKRQDWKEKATRAEVERDMLAKQLEELKKAPPAPPPAAAPLEPIDPSVDPEGYHRRNMAAHLNAQLNNSELLIRDKLGDAAVDAAVAEFKEASQNDPTLFSKLYQQKHPYAWLMKEVDRMRLQREVGDDPEKWRAAEREKMRKELEAEITAKAPPVSPVAGMAPSLATVRSAAPRNAPAFSGPPSLDDILQQKRAR